MSITSPDEGSQLTGWVTITAAIFDDALDVTSMTFLVDGNPIGTDTTSPYTVRWNSGEVRAGPHTIRAEALDTEGNVFTSPEVTVTVTVAPPPGPSPTPSTVSIISPANGAHVKGIVVITAIALAPVSSVTVRVDGKVIGSDSSSPYRVTWDTGNVAPGSHTLRAEARDAGGSVWASADVTVTVGSTTDSTAPTVSIASPAGGAQVTGTVVIAAIASDNVGVTSVTVRVDGTAIGSDDSSPYRVSWDTAKVAPGSHTLRAEARDAAGNVGTSAAVTVTVTGNQPPSVTMTAPTNGSTYQAPATITLAANATDPDGSVARVDFYEGSSLIGSDATSPFSLSWTASNARTYAFSAQAVDNAGAVTKSASVSVTVKDAVHSGTAIFEPPADQSVVMRYQLDVFPNGADPETSTPIATQNLGKPTATNGEISVDISQTLASLKAGTYISTVTAVGFSQSARSAPSSPFVIGSQALSASSISLTRDAAALASTSTPPERSTPAMMPDPGASHGTLWVTNSSTSLVTAFDATTGDVLATIPVGLTPAGIAAPRGIDKIYVADEGSDTVSVISKATMTVARTIPLPAPSGRKPHHISASPDGRFVYVGELGANVVDVIDTATDELSARFGAGWPGSKTRVVIPDQTGDVLYAVSSGTASSPSTLVALEATTGRWLWQLPIDGEPSNLLLGPDGRTGALMRHGDSRITLIDLERRAVVKEIDLGTDADAETLQLSADGRFLVMALRSMPARVAIVDLAEMVTVRTVPLAGPATRNTLSAAQLSYVGVSESSDFPPAVVAVDAVSRTIVNRFRFPGGGSPFGIVFDPYGP